MQKSHPVGQVAQLVEQWTENPRVGGSSPPLTTSGWLPKATARTNKRLPDWEPFSMDFPVTCLFLAPVLTTGIKKATSNSANGCETGSYFAWGKPVVKRD